MYLFYLCINFCFDIHLWWYHLFLLGFLCIRYSAIYGIVKYKRSHAPIIKAVKLTNFANALTSIMLTQIVLLDNYADTSIYNSNLMNGLTGMAIGVAVIILGLYMIIGINKVIR